MLLAVTETVPRSRWASRLSPANIAAIAVLASIPAKLLPQRLSDPDLWWHLRTGGLIAGAGKLPGTDPYSFTVPGKRWVVQEWGSELILHWIRDAFGLYGLLVWRAAMVVLIYVLVARLLVRRMGSGIGTWVVLALVAYSGSLSWTERPNLFSFVLFVVTLDLLDRRDRNIWWFVPLAIGWANLHGMVILGIGLVGLVAAAEGLKVAFHWESADALWAKRLALVTGAGFLGMMLNPYGPGLLLHALSLIGTVGRIITEWASPDFHDVGTIPFFILLLVLIASLSLTPERPDPTDVALALAFTALALSAVRNLTLASIVLGLVVARTAPSAIAAALPRRRERAEMTEGSSVLLGGVALVLTLAVLTIVALNGLPASGRSNDIISKAYPIAAIDELKRPGVRVFSLDLWAGLVIDRAWPEAKVYMDTRVDMYGSTLARRYIQIAGAGRQWQTNLDRYCTTHVLVRRRDSITQVLSLSPDWRIEREDGRSVTFARRAPAPGCEAYPIP